MKSLLQKNGQEKGKATYPSHIRMCWHVIQKVSIVSKDNISHDTRWCVQRRTDQGQVGSPDRGLNEDGKAIVIQRERPVGERKTEFKLIWPNETPAALESAHWQVHSARPVMVDFRVRNTRLVAPQRRELVTGEREPAVVLRVSRNAQ